MRIKKDGLRLTRLFAGADDESHVEEVEYALEPATGSAKAEHIAVSGITFRLWGRRRGQRLTTTALTP
jgi:hypothetical protein